MVICRSLATVDNSPDRTFKECMNGIVEEAERDKCVLVLVFNSLGGLLESGKHRTLTAGKMLSGIAMLTNLCEDVLHQSELIRNKRICFDKVILTGITFQVQNSLVECKEVFQHSTVLAVTERKHIGSVVSLGENTLFDDFVNRGG